MKPSQSATRIVPWSVAATAAVESSCTERRSRDSVTKRSRPPPSHRPAQPRSTAKTGNQGQAGTHISTERLAWSMSMSSSRWWTLERGGDGEGSGGGEGVSERMMIPSGSGMVVVVVKRRAAGGNARACVRACVRSACAWSWGPRGPRGAVDPGSGPTWPGVSVAVRAEQSRAEQRAVVVGGCRRRRRRLVAVGPVPPLCCCRRTCT